MPIIPDEELDEMLSNERFDSVIAALKKIGDRPAARLDDIEKVLGTIATVLAQLQKKDLSVDLDPLVEELSSHTAELQKMFAVRPTNFRIERNKLGLIENVVPEYK